MTLAVDVPILRRMVSVPQVLERAGFRVKTPKRAECPFCRGRSRLTLAYTDSLWHCHRCSKGGDVFTLVQEVRGGGFKEALAFLAQMAGLPVGGLGSRESTRVFSEQRKHRVRVEQAADKLARGERFLRLRYREAIHQLDLSQRRASALLATAVGNPSAARQVDEDALWRHLQEATERRRILIAGYYLLSFGRMEDRARFVARPTEREAMIAAALESGFVLTDSEKAKLMEVCLE